MTTPSVVAIGPTLTPDITNTDLLPIPSPSYATQAVAQAILPKLPVMMGLAPSPSFPSNTTQAILPTPHMMSTDLAPNPSPSHATQAVAQAILPKLSVTGAADSARGSMSATGQTNLENPPQPKEEVPSSQPSSSPLALAISCGDSAEVDRLLKEQNQDVNAVDRNGRTPLQIAFHYKQAGIVKQLILAGANIHAATSEGNTALHVASLKGDVPIVQVLIEAKAEINAANKKGNTALLFASSRGHLAIVQKLMKAEADVNAVNEDKKTALHQAVLNGHLEIVRELIADRATHIDAADNEGNTALHYACLHGRYDIAKELLDAKANTNLANKKRNTALLFASARGHLTIVQELIRAQADIHAVDEEGNTALHRAVLNGHYDIAKELIDTGAHLDAVNAHGHSPLVLAITHGRQEVADLLEEKGADVKLAKAIVDRVTLAHIWGIGGTSEITRDGLPPIPIRLEGGIARHFQKVASESFANFCSQPDNNLTQEAMDTVQDTLHNAYPYNHNLTSADIAERINHGRPMLITGGFSRCGTKPGHAIGIVVTPEAVMICNRGTGRDRTHTIKYYRRDPTIPMTASMVEKFTTLYSDQAKYETGIEAAIQEMRLTHVPENGIQQSKQKVGICARAAVTSGILALFHSLNLKRRLSKNPADTCFTPYKKFKTYMQLSSLEDYLKTCPAQYRDPYLLKEIHQKTRRKPRLLNAVRQQSQPRALPPSAQTLSPIGRLQLGPRPSTTMPHRRSLLDLPRPFG